MKTISLRSPDGRTFRFRCADIFEGVAIDPQLDAHFDDTPNEQRSGRQMAWWGVPFVRTVCIPSAEFKTIWPNGVRFDVLCLDGGAWDRSTWWGSFKTLFGAVSCAVVEGPVWRKGGAL